MPENPVYSRDDGHFIYLATVELGAENAGENLRRFFIAIAGRVAWNLGGTVWKKEG
jgi:hypothetical protein